MRAADEYEREVDEAMAKAEANNQVRELRDFHLTVAAIKAQMAVAAAVDDLRSGGLPVAFDRTTLARLEAMFP